MRYDFGDFSLDVDARQLRRGGDALRLSPKALELLIVLVAERPRVIPKQELYDRLWPATYVVDANLPVLIGDIRRALADDRRELIRTVHKTGYSFPGPVREVQSMTTTSSEGFVHLLLYDNRHCHLNEGENLVGREPLAQVFIPSASVSRRHALIHIRHDQARVTDLASKNGTFIENRPASSECALVDGNMIRFGEVLVRYRCCAADGATNTFTSGSEAVAITAGRLE